MSFSCPHCHYSDSEIQPGGPIQDQGVKYTVQVDTREVHTRRSQYRPVPYPVKFMYDYDHACKSVCPD